MKDYFFEYLRKHHMYKANKSKYKNLDNNSF